MASDDFVVVATRAGAVRGRWRPTTGGRGNPRSAAFEGIPFAQAPVGELRFQAPVPTAPWEGVRDALAFGPTAQRGDPGTTLIPEPSVPGESTLNVNVYTPSPEAPRNGSGLPVLVWIHGGGFTAGSPASPWYDGRNFNRDDVVTVTISYRLGFDGFGYIDGAPTNRAVRDWLLALEWVQENIAAFGGDPGRVVIAGQSAGGGAVLTLLGMEQAQHLFHGVFAISGALADVKEEKARALSEKLAGALGVPATLDGFRSVSEERVLEAQQEATKLDPSNLEEMLTEGLGLGPQIDGELIDRATPESLRAGVGADKPLVLGSTNDEFTMALDGAKQVLRLMPRGAVLARFGVPKPAQRAYLGANPELAKRPKHLIAGRVLSDRMFRVPLVGIISARGSAPTWLYQFTWPSGTSGFAEHCLDVPFFFDCLDGPEVEPLAGPNPPQHLADSLHMCAVNFIERGDPGWPRYEEPKKLARIWDIPVRDASDPLRAIAALLT